MTSPVGYVVVEFNQASSVPGLPPSADLHLSLDDALAEMEELVHETNAVGRSETYRVAEVFFVEED